MAQTKKVTVELGFKANTEAVKKNINELAANLKQISDMQIGLKGSDLDQARKAAKELTLELQKAVNVDTGRLDLNKLTSSLKKGHKDIVGLSSELLKAGPIGQKSFLQIAQAMSQAEVPMVKINQSLKDFMDNLGRNAKWQIAQMAIQGVQGSIQNAVREAEQLNKALNDIRIVTGYDKTVMAQFAKEANKAAKELKTTTKEYAEASLIFYQQGLNAAEVAKRAETVIKMSQVTGDTARAVSDQMTAIWNNFADGSKTLEYYADSMAKLGAETAASTSEIANGLEKFAAIAETVGLSYETAMASVATVIDKTRQSADVVGTAFKTIFARVQGLKLDGETDDGVSLNKYSAALERVGVDVLTTSGELRDMDEILNDLGAKWQLLGRESQVAVAQVVGGARQYNQLLSLMDNWSEVQSNILKAEGSTGEISKQANIWAESYEAASKRVEEAKARAAENFLNSEDIVNLTNAFADLITWVDKFIDSFGGVVPLALTITGLFSHKLVPIVKTGFTALSNNFKTFMGNTLGTSKKLIQNTQNEFNNFLEAYKKGDIEDSLKAQIEWNQKLIKVKQHMAEITKYMSEQEKESAMAALSVFEESVQAAIKAGGALTESQRKVKQAKGKITKMDVITGAHEEVFRQHEITTDEEKNKAREYARGNVQKKLDLIDKIQPIEEAINARDASINEKKGRLNEMLKGREISDIYRDRHEWLGLKEQVEAEGNAEDVLVAETRIKQLEQILSLSREITKEEKEQTEQQKQLNEINTYKDDRRALETALDLQKKDQSLNTEEGRLNTSFGTTDFRIDEQLTLEQRDRKRYESVMKATSHEATYIDGKEIQLSFDEQNQKMQISMQNYEVLKKKALDYQMVAEELLQINMEFAGNIDNMSKSMVDATELKTKYEEAVTARESAEEEAKQFQEGDEGYIEAQVKIAKAKKEEEKSLQKLSKAQIHNMKVTKNATKAIKENKDQILKLAKESGASEKEISELSAAIDDIDNSPNAFKEVAINLKSLETVAFSVSNSIDVLGDEMEDALIQSGVSSQRIEAFKKALDELKQSALKNAAAQRKAKDSSKELGDQMADFSDKFESIISGVGQVTAAFSGLNAGVNQISDVFTEAGTPMEKFLGILGGITSLLPVTIMLYKALTSETYKSATASLAKAAASKVEAMADKKGFLAKIPKLLLGIAAKVLSGDYVTAAIVAGILTLAGAGAIAGIKNGENKKEQQREQYTANIEAAEKSNEMASAVQTESQAIDELIGQYNKLSDSEKASSELKDDIINQVDKVIEKYQEYASSINMATDAEQNLKSAIRDLEIAQTLGDIEGIKKAQEKADLIIAEKAKKQNNLGIAGTLGNLRLKEDAKDVKIKEDYVQRHVGGAGEEEEKAIQIIQEAMGGSAKKTRARGTKIQLRTDSAEHFVEDYDKLQTAVDNMLKSSDSRVKDPNINDTLRECQELLSTYKEDYDSLKSQIATGAAYNAQIAIGKVAKTGNSISNISDYNTYKNYKQTVQDQINSTALTDKEKSDALDSLNTQLSANSALENFAKIDSKLDSLSSKSKTQREEFEKLFTKFEDESGKTIEAIDEKAFLEVDLNLYTEPDEIRAEANRIQEEFNREEIEIKLKSIVDIKDKLKPDGMTEKDWKEISEHELFAENPEAFKSFIDKSYAEQIAELTELETKAQNDKQSSLEREIASYQKTIDDMTSTASAKEDAREQIELLNVQLAILKKVRLQQKEYIDNLRMSDIGDIFHDIDQELNKLEKSYKKLSELQESLYGTDSIQIYDDLLTNLKDQNRELEYKALLNDAELKFQRSKLSTQTKESLGIELTYDEEGNLTNYLEVLKEFERRKELGQDTTELEAQFNNNYSNYKNTQNTALDIKDSQENIKRLEKETKLKKITAKVDLQLELKDMHLKQINYDISKSLEDVYKSGGAVDGFEKKFNIIGNIFNDIAEEKRNLDNAFAAGEIDESQYLERLKALQDQSLENQQAIDELSDAMANYYGTILKNAEQEIGNFTSQMDHLNSTLEHYKTLLDLIGESSTTSMKRVLQAQETTAKNNYDVSKQWYEDRSSEAKVLEERVLEYTGDKTSEDYKALVQRWQDAKEVANKAQEDMFADAQAWATATKDMIAFSMNEAAKSIESSLSGGLGFEQLQAQMSRKSLLQEEFLTATNQTYEVEKMMRSIENDMLKTDNARAKQRLKAFQDQTKQLKSSEKLSKTELDIQQKKYDLLLAELALEEAKNAKSTVRLTRTADGGFGYVYTADEDKVNETKQAKDDAENALYNARLDAANTYTEKRVQAQQELVQQLQSLTEQYQNGEIATKDLYLKLQKDLITDYEELYNGYSEIYTNVVSEDAKAAGEAWSNGFQTLLIEAGKWDEETGKFVGGFSEKIQTYTSAVEKQTNKWEAFLVTFKDSVKLNLGETTNATGEIQKDVNGLSATLDGITSSSNNLATALLGEDKESGVVGAMDDLIDAGAEFLDTKSSKWFSTLGSLSKSFEKLSEKIAKTIQTASGLSDITLPKVKEQSSEDDFAIGTVNDGYIDFFEKYLRKVMNGETIDINKDLTGSKDYDQGIRNALKDAQDQKKTYDAALSAGSVTRSRVNEHIASQIAFAEETGQRVDTSLKGLGVTGAGAQGNTYISPEKEPSPKPQKTETQFSWSNVIESWKKGDFYGAEASLLKNLGSDVGGQARWGYHYYNQTGFDNVTKYFDDLAKNNGRFDSSEYAAHYNQDIIMQQLEAIKDKQNGRKNAIKIFLEKENLNSDVISKIKEQVGSNGIAFLQALKYLKSYDPTLYEELAQQGINNGILDYEQFKQKAPMELIFGLANIHSGENWGPGTYYYKLGTLEYTGKWENALNAIAPSYNSNYPDLVFLNGTSSYFKRGQLLNNIGFDTGGYTGSWGPEGKMAMLHEKEIVLNKEDTANLLESVQLLRSILTTIDLQTANAQFSSLLSSAYFAPSTTGDTLEQNVHIEASFPNVTDRSEIEEAFNTLVNRASQYANRKR